MEQAIQDFVKAQTSFVEKERDTEAEQSQKLTGQLAATHLQRLGLALVNLRITGVRTGLGGRTVLTLEAPIQGDPIQATTLRGGDIVRVEAAGAVKEEETRQGVVVSMTQSKVTVALGPDDDVPEAWKERCTVRKLANDITYRRTLRALKDLGELKRRPSLHDVLFRNSEAAADAGIYEGKIEFFDDSLNESQKRAVRLALGPGDVAMVHGPPGTGKTHTVVEIIRQMCLRGQRLLVCAPSNVAVDNLAERLGRTKIPLVRLGHSARILPKAAALSLDSQMRDSDGGMLLRDIRRELDTAMAKLPKAKRAERRELYGEIKELRKEFRQREAKVLRETIGASRVVLATLSGAASKEINNEGFDVAIVDEATQASEAECWIAALKAPKLILAGDHHQLPPTTKQTTEAPTMFDRVRKRLPGRCSMLEIQYRMHRDIAHVSSEKLYEGKLQPYADVAEHLLCELPGVAETEDTLVPLLLIDTMGSGMLESADTEGSLLDADSKCNSGEAELAAAHVAALIDAGVAGGEIAVISPYVAQVRLLKLLISPNHPDVEIGTVDGFQGREKEAVVLSMVRSNDAQEVGFLKDHRRINVAVTRARRHLCVIADSETVSKGSPFLSALFVHIEEAGEIRYV
ncbi:hypothetical protein GGI07_005862 [Coemansia sp. Benny D115]|nr:hypothetical protein GGI07_005862 [Coemansia sp. Benny D115]